MSYFLIIEAACWWLAFDAAETLFSNVVSEMLPNYKKRLSESGDTRQYMGNAPALINSIVCTGISVNNIYSKTWSYPIPLVTYCIYDSVRGTTRTMNIHHSLALFLVFLSNMNKHSRAVAPYFLFTELSTIFLCLLGIIRGASTSPRSLTVQWEREYAEVLKELFVASFLGCRIIAPLPCLYYLFENDWLALLFALPLFFMNVHWLSKLHRFYFS